MEAAREKYLELKEAHGAEHPDTLSARNNWAVDLYLADRDSEAEAEFRAILETKRSALGVDDPSTLTAWANWAAALDALGTLEESLKEHQALLEARKRVLGYEHRDTIATVMALNAVTDKIDQSTPAIFQWPVMPRTVG